jgi:hypothetical protein
VQYTAPIRSGPDYIRSRKNSLKLTEPFKISKVIFPAVVKLHRKEIILTVHRQFKNDRTI